MIYYENSNKKLYHILYCLYSYLKILIFNFFSIKFYFLFFINEKKIYYIDFQFKIFIKINNNEYIIKII